MAAARCEDIWQNPKLEIGVITGVKGRDAETGTDLRGVLAVERIPCGSKLFSLTAAGVFNSQLCMQILASACPEAVAPLSMCPGWTVVAIVLESVRAWKGQPLSNKLRSVQKLRDWIDSLPASEQLDSVCLWKDDEAAKLLSGPSVMVNLALQRLRARLEVTTIYNFVAENCAIQRILPPTKPTLTLDDFFHAYALLQSRGFEEESPFSEQTSEDFGSLERPMSMFPWADMLNHAPGAGSWHHVTETGEVIFKSGVEFAPVAASAAEAKQFDLNEGEQCCIDYATNRDVASRTNSHFLEHCGFVLRNNPFEAYPLQLYIAVPALDESCEEDNPRVAGFEARQRLRALFVQGVVSVVELQGDETLSNEECKKLRYVCLDINEQDNIALRFNLEAQVQCMFTTTTCVYLRSSDQCRELLGILYSFSCTNVEFEQFCSDYTNNIFHLSPSDLSESARTIFRKILEEEHKLVVSSLLSLSAVSPSERSDLCKELLQSVEHELAGGMRCAGIEVTGRHFSDINYEGQDVGRKYCTLYGALEQRNAHKLRQALAEGAPLCALSPSWTSLGGSQTLVWAAIFSGSEDCLLAVVEKLSDTEGTELLLQVAKENSKVSPLAAILTSGYSLTVFKRAAACLYKAGVKAQDSLHDCLQWAISCGQLDACRALREVGVRIKDADKFRQDPDAWRIVQDLNLIDI